MRTMTHKRRILLEYLNLSLLLREEQVSSSITRDMILRPKHHAVKIPCTLVLYQYCRNTTKLETVLEKQFSQFFSDLLHH